MVWLECGVGQGQQPASLAGNLMLSFLIDGLLVLSFPWSVKKLLEDYFSNSLLKSGASSKIKKKKN